VAPCISGCDVCTNCRAAQAARQLVHTSHAATTLQNL